jgi:hypothetical protein
MTELRQLKSGTIALAAGGRSLRGARRIAVIAIIASMSITAIVGIVALLSGEFGQMQSRILLTTLLVTGFSVTALCHLAVAGRPVRVVGFIGIMMSGVAFLLGVALVWFDWSATSVDLWRWFGVSGILALSLTQANLLLLLAGRRHIAVRVMLGLTLAAIAGVAFLLILPILTGYEILGADGDAYWRTFGVVGILDALGYVVLPVVALFLRDLPVDGAAPVGDATFAGPADAAAVAPAETAAPIAVSDSAALEQRIIALGEASGLEREALLSAALDAFEAAV